MENSNRNKVRRNRVVGSWKASDSTNEGSWTMSCRSENKISPCCINWG